MKNTIIIKDNGLAINSAEYEDYALVITDFGGDRTFETPDGDTVEEFDTPPDIEIRAVKSPNVDEVLQKSLAGKQATGDFVCISTFHSIEIACAALQELFRAINEGKATFDVRKHKRPF